MVIKNEQCRINNLIRLAEGKSSRPLGATILSARGANLLAERVALGNVKRASHLNYYIY